MLFINEGQVLVAALDDGNVIINAVHGSHTKLVIKCDNVLPATLISCSGEDDVVGILRGLDMQLVRVKFSNTSQLEIVGLATFPVEKLEGIAHQSSFKIDQLLIPTTTTLLHSSCVFMESPWYDDVTSKPHSLNTINENSKQVAGDNNIQLTSMHMVKDADTIRFVAIGNTKKGGSFYSSMYTASLDIRYNVNSTESGKLLFYQKVKLGNSFCTSAFNDTTCAISLPAGVFILNLTVLFDSPSNDGKSLPLTLDEFKGATQVLLTTKANAVGGTSWSGSVLNLQALASSKEYSKSLFICKNHKSCFLKLEI